MVGIQGFVELLRMPLVARFVILCRSSAGSPSELESLPFDSFVLIMKTQILPENAYLQLYAISPNLAPLLP